MVEAHHFTPAVESLRKGSSGTVLQDLNYTLNSFPNHPRALVSMLNLIFARQGKRFEELSKEPECYFYRAVSFFVPTIFDQRDLHGVLHLVRWWRLLEARSQFDAAESGGYDEPLFHYNYGLLLVDMREWDKALHHAKKAYGSGVTFPGLKRKLQAERKMEIGGSGSRKPVHSI